VFAVVHKQLGNDDDVEVKRGVDYRGGGTLLKQIDSGCQDCRFWVQRGGAVKIRPSDVGDLLTEHCADGCSYPGSSWILGRSNVPRMLVLDSRSRRNWKPPQPASAGTVLPVSFASIRERRSPGARCGLVPDGDLERSCSSSW
jgi:hypothetical protein